MAQFSADMNCSSMRFPTSASVTSSRMGTHASAITPGSLLSSATYSTDCRMSVSHRQVVDEILYRLPQHFLDAARVASNERVSSRNPSAVAVAVAAAVAAVAVVRLLLL